MVYIKHSYPHINLWRSGIFLSWHGRIFSSVESLTIILRFFLLASLRPPYSGWIAMMFWSSLTNSWNNILVTACFSVWPLMDTLSRPCAIDVWTTFGWCIKKLYRPFFTNVLVFVYSLYFGLIYHNNFPVLIALHFVLEYTNMWTAVFVWNQIVLKID